MLKRIRIRDLPLSSRPREKMAAGGQQNLSEGELVAILLGTGSAKQNAIMLSETLLRRFPLQKMANISLQDLAAFPGIGKSKACRILAAFELGKRVFAQASLDKIVIRTKEDILLHLRDIVERKQEYLVVFYLNARHELLQKEIVGIGSLNSLLLTPKEIFSPALQKPCASLIVAHNHPSGDPSPSDQDIAFTKRIHEAGEILGIQLLDHLIVARNGYFSFREDKRGK